MNILSWEVYLRRTPTAVRYCKRCGVKSVFESSGLFRINAQQKLLDIWLIYNCQACDAIWNLTIISRVNANTIKREILEKYTNNDHELAMSHATDTTLFKRNGAERGFAEADIIGAEYDWNSAAEIHLVSKWPLENKAASLIRQKLNLSGNAFEKMYEEGKIICLSGHKLINCKMIGEIVFQVTP